MPQAAFRIDIIKFGGADKCVYRRGSFSTAVGTGEKIIFPPESNSAQGPFRGIVVDFDSPIVTISGESLPARERVVNGAREV